MLLEASTNYPQQFAYIFRDVDKSMRRHITQLFYSSLVNAHSLFNKLTFSCPDFFNINMQAYFKGILFL